MSTAEIEKKREFWQRQWELAIWNAEQRPDDSLALEALGLAAIHLALWSGAKVG